MRMGKFKVGDRVRVLGENNPVGDFKGLKVGAETKIKKESSVNGGWILDGSKEMYFYTEDQFELIEEPWDYDPRTATNDNALKIEAGKYYKTRDGRKVGPVTCWGGTPGTQDVPFPFKAGGILVSKNGFDQPGDESKHDLIAEWVDEPAFTFNVGDRVIRTNGMHDAIGTVKKAGVKHFTIAWDDGSGDSSTWQAHELRIFKEPATLAIVAAFHGGQPKPNPTPYVHPSEAAATTEAERLARLSPGTEFGVFVLAGKRVADVTVRAA